MKTFSLLLLCVSVLTVAGTEQFSPELPKLSQEEIGEWVGKVQPSVEIDKSVIRRGLISDQNRRAPPSLQGQRAKNKAGE